MSIAKQAVTLTVAEGMGIAAAECPGDDPTVVLAHGGGRTHHWWGGTGSVVQFLGPT